MLDQLRRRDFPALTRTIEAAVQALERDYQTEPNLGVIMTTFDSADETLTPLLDAWVKREPRNPFARLARARHFSGLAWERRGGALANATSEQQFANMTVTFEKAKLDAEAALGLRPGLTHAFAVLIKHAQATGGARACEELARRALAAAPASYRVWTSLMNCVRPRWGGSHERMQALANQARSVGAANPRLSSLAGSVDHDLALVAFEQKDYLAAAVAEERALEFGDDANFYEMLGKALYRLGSYGPAREAFDRASALSPQGVTTLIDQAYLAAWTGDVSLARRQLDLARLIDPTYDGFKEFPQEWLTTKRHPDGSPVVQ